MPVEVPVEVQCFMTSVGPRPCGTPLADPVRHSPTPAATGPALSACCLLPLVLLSVSQSYRRGQRNVGPLRCFWHQVG